MVQHLPRTTLPCGLWTAGGLLTLLPILSSLPVHTIWHREKRRAGAGRHFVSRWRLAGGWHPLAWNRRVRAPAAWAGVGRFRPFPQSYAALPPYHLDVTDMVEAWTFPSFLSYVRTSSSGGHCGWNWAFWDSLRSGLQRRYISLCWAVDSILNNIKLVRSSMPVFVRFFLSNLYMGYFLAFCCYRASCIICQFLLAHLHAVRVAAGGSTGEGKLSCRGRMIPSGGGRVGTSGRRWDIAICVPRAAAKADVSIEPSK